jgi:hypothetical protein
MTNKVLLVTAPDDVNFDGLRLTLIGLSHDQTSIVSAALNLLESIPTFIMYVWSKENIEWLIDKKHKSDLIIFNAEYENLELVGYFAAQPNSYYLGNLKTLGTINNRVIHDTDQLLNLLKETISRYELRFE